MTERAHNKKSSALLNCILRQCLSNCSISNFNFIEFGNKSVGLQMPQ